MFTCLKADTPGTFPLSARDAPVVIQEGRRSVHTDAKLGSEKFASDPTNSSRKQQAPPPQTKVVVKDEEQVFEEKVNNPRMQRSLNLV